MIADIASEAKPMTPIEDYNVGVFTLNEVSGHLRIIKKSTWDQVISGEAFKNGLPPKAEDETG